MPVSPVVMVASAPTLLVLVGSASSCSLVTTVWRRTFCTSTTGAAPVTVIVSSSPPTRRSAETFAEKPAVRLMPSRMTVAKPVSVNVTLYTPGRSGVSTYRPSVSVTATRCCSMSAGLVAVTVTPGRTAPEVSRTVPAICAS